MRSSLKILAYCSIAFLFLMNSCTFYFKTSDVRNSFSDTKNKISEAINKAETDKGEKEEMLNQLITYAGDPAIAPYPRLAATIDEMADHIAMMYTIQTRLDCLMVEFDLIAKDKKKIKSDKPEWKEFKSTRSDYKKTLKDMKKIFKKYFKTSRSFLSITKKHGITRYEVAYLQGEIDSYIGTIDTNIMDVKEKMKELREKHSGDENQASNQGDYEQKQELMSQLELILTEISGNRNQIDILLDNFKMESEDRTEIWCGPGTKTFTLHDDIQIIGKEINRLINCFYKISMRL